MRKKLYSIIAGIIILIYILPFIPLFLSSFSSQWSWPQLLPKLSFRAWNYILIEDLKTREAIYNSFLIAGILVIINIILALPAANAIARGRVKGKKIIEFLLFAPIIIPPFISAMGIHFNFIKLGLTENLTGLILAQIIPSLPYMIRALIIAFRTLSFDYENVAKLLGANYVQRYRYVIIPHLLPALIAGASLSVLISLSQYITVVIIGGGEILTLSLLIFPYISGGDTRIASAYVILFIFINIFCLFVLEKFLKIFY